MDENQSDLILTDISEAEHLGGANDDDEVEETDDHENGDQVNFSQHIKKIYIFVLLFPYIFEFIIYTFNLIILFFTLLKNDYLIKCSNLVIIP